MQILRRSKVRTRLQGVSAGFEQVKMAEAKYGAKGICCSWITMFWPHVNLMKL